MKNNKKYYLGTLAMLSIAVIASLGFKAANEFYTFKIHSAKDIKSFFRYTPDEVPFISSHRGGSRKGFPENCIATFENTLSHTHSLLEFDPHYTKDSAIVIMHDPTLDRTSNGTGKIADHTLQEIKSFRLKDEFGNLTNYPIPTLDELLEWAKGKTIMVMDMKDVPMAARVKKVEEHHAIASTIIMAYTVADAQICYKLNKNIVMEVMFNTVEKVKAFDNSGVPWENVVVFVSQKPGTERAVFDEIHKRGAMCIIGTSFGYDDSYKKGQITIEELNNDYKGVLESGADIIETNLGIEAGSAINSLQQSKLTSSAKAKYF